jgi:uroporphyrinogen-III synthase
MSRRLFITRPLAEDAPLYLRLHERGFDVSGHSMLTFEPLAIPKLEPTEWLFAYSPRGVKFLLDQKIVERVGNRLQCAKGPIKLGAVGQGTANAWAEAGLDVDFIGDGEPASTAAAFAKTHCLESTPHVTFLQAANSRRSVERLLADHVKTTTLSVYQSKINGDASAPLAEVYYLTSPLSAEAVLRQLDQKRPFDIWCVGSVTAARVRELGFTVQQLVPLV